MRGNRVRRWFTGKSLALAVVCSSAMSGCVVPIPYDKSVPLPDVESRLPSDIRGRTDQLLVIKQVASWSESKAALGTSTRPPSIVTADFMKGNEFLALARTLKVDSSSGVALCVFALAAGGCGPIAGINSKLEKLCVVTEDGRLIPLVGLGALQRLDTRRRDVIVSALRGGGNAPFSEVDGPCGVSGTTEWPVELLSRIIDFLVRIPAISPRVAASESDLVSNNVLATALRDSWTTGTQAEHAKSGAMLLVSGVWRGVSIAERPRFLTADEFDRFSTSRVTVNADAIITLLPTYASGSYDASNVSVASFCLISSDGRAISASGPTYLESPNTRPRLPNWRDGVVSLLRSGSGSFDAEFPCIPPDTLGWSAADRAAAIGFLAAIPAPARDVTAARADASLRAASDAAAAGVLVLAVMNPAQGHTVVVPKLMASDDARAVASAIRSDTPWEFTASLAPTSPAGSASLEVPPLDYVCVIASNGQAISFGSTFGSTGIRDSWDGSHGFLFSEQSIRDAIAIVGNTGNYRGSFVCSLEQSIRWPEEVRSQVIRFLKRIPIGT